MCRLVLWCSLVFAVVFRFSVMVGVLAVCVCVLVFSLVALF